MTEEVDAAIGSEAWVELCRTRVGWEASVPGDATVDYRRLEKAGIPGLATTLRRDPEEALRCLAVALASDPECLFVRLVNYDPGVCSFASVKGNWIGRLVSLRGLVSKATFPTPLILDMKLVCTTCGWTQSRGPRKDCRCEGPRCKGRSFRPAEETVKTTIYQEIELEERISFGGGPGDRIAVELRDDLAGRYFAGDVLTVVGIVRSVEGPFWTGPAFPAPRPLYLQAISLSKEKETASLSRGDVRSIREIHRECGGEALRALVRAFCPEICGHRVLKAALLFALMAGNLPEERLGAASTHGTVHVLVVGDTGLQSHTLLKAAARVAAGCSYVRGGQEMKTGWMGSFSESGQNRDHSSHPMFEAGPMLRAGTGVCCVERLERFPGGQTSLSQAMTAKVLQYIERQMEGV